ncbi:MAG: zf-HC2 domain-containing protein [Stenotrophobium sp.]
MNRSDDAMTSHRQAWDLIPWMINGRASDEDRRTVEKHLGACADCREEFEFQQQLHAQMNRASIADADPQAALQRLWTRIDQGDNPVVAETLPHGRTVRRPGVGFLTRGLIAAVIVEAIALSALSTAFLMRGDAGRTAAVYQTLTAPVSPASPATLRVVLAPAVTLRELQALLGQTRMQIVSGPSEAGVYSLAPLSRNATDSDRVLAQLRADRHVLLAEPVGAAVEPSR